MRVLSLCLPVSLRQFDSWDWDWTDYQEIISLPHSQVWSIGVWSNLVGRNSTATQNTRRVQTESLSQHNVSCYLHLGEAESSLYPVIRWVLWSLRAGRRHYTTREAAVCLLESHWLSGRWAPVCAGPALSSPAGLARHQPVLQVPARTVAGVTSSPEIYLDCHILSHVTYCTCVIIHLTSSSMFKASHGARGGELGIYSFPDQSHDPDVALLMICWRVGKYGPEPSQRNHVNWRHIISDIIMASPNMPNLLNFSAAENVLTLSLQDPLNIGRWPPSDTPEGVIVIPIINDTGHWGTYHIWPELTPR